MSETVEVPVLIVGAGPVGVSVANLLGTYGVATLIVDRSPAILDYPRAVGLDDEALRAFQAAGLAEPMLKDMIQNVPMRMYTATKRCYAEILPTTREFGWFRRNLFSQPLGEQTLRDGLKRYPDVRMELGIELVAMDQDADGVNATLRRADGSEQQVRAQYLVASDGARSTVREGILKVPYEGRTHANKWVVIECEDDPLDAPYTALHCEPRRPYVCLRLPYGLRRWEFMLFEGEDDEQMLQPQKVQELLRSHVAHPEDLKVIRARVYTHNSRVAKSFVIGRVCLAGDAAHITPPWIGQGLNAGMRDVFNLAWKLAWIVKGRLKPTLLQSYHDERHAHAQAMIDLADTFGAVLSQRNRFLAWLRDRFFVSISGIPRVRDYVLQMKFKPMPRFSTGVVLNTGERAHDDLVGRMFIQPRVEAVPGEEQRMDDIIGGRFALLNWRCNPLADASPALLAQLARLGCDLYMGVRARSGTHAAERPAPGVSKPVVLQDSENALHFWFEKAGVDWVLLRPDRFVAAAGKASGAQRELARFCDAVLPDGMPPAAPRIEAPVDSPAHGTTN